MIATRHDIDSFSDANNELKDPIDTCELDCRFCTVLDTFDDQTRGKFALVI